MNRALLIFSFLFLLSCSTEETETELQETFGNWSPEFTNQISTFTQTRTGSKGTQQSRAVNVTSSSAISSSTEESINQDVNNDGDLYEDIEVVITTYSIPSSLTDTNSNGSHQITTYNIIEDNDMGITIGNNFYSVSNGLFYNYGELDECSSVYNYDLFIYSDGIQYGNDSSDFDDSNVLYGEGDYIYFELMMNQSTLKTGNYNDMLTTYNQIYNQSFELLDDFEDWFCQNNDCDDDAIDFEYKPCDQMDLMSTNSSYSLDVSTDNGDYIESGDIIFSFTQGQLSISVDSDDVYTVKLSNGKNENSLPVKLFYRGYIGFDNAYANSGKSQN